MLSNRQKVVLTWPPRCGKTHIFNQVVTEFHCAGLSVTSCGSPGVAAALVHGTTVHSWADFCNGGADVW